MRHIDRPADGLRVGAVGLGIGTIATYAEPGDEIRFYELNPAVVDLARQHFSFLGQSGAEIDIVIGDGRVSLEQELAEVGGRNYDLLVIDAFTSDAIPVHLLTREAVGVYWSHLKPGGVLAIHVTNSYVDLVPVVANVAAALGKHALPLQSPAAGEGIFSSDWLVLTEGAWSGLSGTTEGLTIVPPLPDPAARVWTDDYSDLLRTLR
jgi:spermidine synthase